jgi:hypothetical protein
LQLRRAIRGSVSRRQISFCFLLDSARHDFVKLDLSTAHMNTKIVPIGCAAICVALLCAIAIAAYAATITVTNTHDSGACSLRQALADATDGDTINFDPALNGQTINLTSAELAIDKNITISGPGPNLLTVSRSSGTFRIFHVLPGHTDTIQGLTISGGNATPNGSGVLNDHAVLTMDSCAVCRTTPPSTTTVAVFTTTVQGAARHCRS